MPASPELAGFVRDHFKSVWSLELLLLLLRDPLLSWQREQLVAALRASDSIVATSLEYLVAGGLIVRDKNGMTKYAPANADLDRLAREIDALYTSKPDAVRRLIVSNAGLGLTAFADAFKLKRD